MLIPHSNDIIEDILKSKNLTRQELESKGVEYKIPNIKHLDELLAWNKEIVVFADCDTDGLCAAAICKIYFDRFDGYIVHYKIASRDRRGFQKSDVEEIIFDYPNATAILTVDCGISSVDAVKLANESGLDVLITDHHEPQAEIPNCKIINPKLDSYNGFKEFCGAGLIYLCFRQLEGDSQEALQFAAIATVADVVPLLKENRYIVKKGLELLNNSRTANAILKSFAAHTKIKIQTTKDIGWSVGPLINSASRLNKESVAFRSIVLGDTNAMKELEELNETRKNIIKEIIQKADNIKLTADCVSIYAETEYIGILGLLAVKLYSMFGLPTIAYCVDKDGVYHYSMRGDDVILFLQSILDKGAKGGGHSGAAGFSYSGIGELPIDWFRAFYAESELRATYTEQQRNSNERISGNSSSDIRNGIQIALDRSVANLRSKEAFGPFGCGFEEPVFYSDDIIIRSNGITSSGKYNKYAVCSVEHNIEIPYYDFNNIIKTGDLDVPIAIEYNINYSSYTYKPVIDILRVYAGR